MHCPHCGTEASEQQKFCRSCGFNLEKVAQLLTEQLPMVAEDQPAVDKAADLKGQLRRTERWLSIALTSFFLILAGGVSWGIISKIMIEKGAVWTGLALLLFIASTAITLFFVARREELREALTGRQSPQPTALPPEKSTVKMLAEAQSELAPSVTEHTTKRLVAHEVREVERNLSGE